MNNVRKKHVHITEKTYSGEIFAILDEIESDYGDNVDNAMDDSDTEFIATDVFCITLPITQMYTGTCCKCSCFFYNH